MIVSLVGYTSNPERTVAMAGRLTRGDKSFAEIEQATEDLGYCRSFIKRLINNGHESVLEHASFTFYMSGISRVCSHQLVRHRIASYSQQSQRFNAADVSIVCPSSIAEKEDALEKFNLACAYIKDVYETLLSIGIPIEDARFVLPEGTMTSLFVTMNARELRHFFKLRLSKHAQWEIRELAKSMLDIVYAIAPSLFEDIYEDVIQNGKEAKMK